MFMCVCACICAEECVYMCFMCVQICIYTCVVSGYVYKSMCKCMCVCMYELLYLCVACVCAYMRCVCVHIRWGGAYTRGMCVCVCVCICEEVSRPCHVIGFWFCPFLGRRLQDGDKPPVLANPPSCHHLLPQLFFLLKALPGACYWFCCLKIICLSH